MARPLMRVAAALAAVQAAQWLVVAAVARSTRADDAGTLLTAAQVGLLLPVALVSVFAVAAVTCGRWAGVWAAAVWALGPAATTPLWDARYRTIYTDDLLPRLLGLTHDSGFRAAALVAAALALTAIGLRRGDTWTAALAGLAAAGAAWTDASAVLALGVPPLAFALGRRPMLAAAALVAAIPGAVAAAAGSGIPPLPAEAGSWQRLESNVLGLQEYFWSMRFLQWLPLAGAVGLARRSAPVAVAALSVVAGWVIVVGAAPTSIFATGSFLPALLPAAPVYALLAASILQLLPPLRRRVAVQASASR